MTGAAPAFLASRPDGPATVRGGARISRVKGRRSAPQRHTNPAAEAPATLTHGRRSPATPAAVHAIGLTSRIAALQSP
jgi:hypothetical protein